MIEVTAEPAHRRVRARMGGLLTVDEVKQFGRDVQAAVEAMRLGDGEFDMLTETEGEIVQTQDVIEMFRRLILEAPLRPRRLATVRSGALAKMQSRRVTQIRDGAVVFDTLAEAEAWLAAP